MFELLSTLGLCCLQVEHFSSPTGKPHSVYSACYIDTLAGSQSHRMSERPCGEWEQLSGLAASAEPTRSCVDGVWRVRRMVQGLALDYG